VKSVVNTVRFPEDFDEAVIHLAEQEGKTPTQIIRGSLIMAWQDYFRERLGEERLQELVAEYVRQKKADEP
jgi:hypothetical protein